MTEFLGFANQNCSTRPDTGTVARAFLTAFNPGDTSWTCTATGYYTFTAIGAGGGQGAVGGGGGAAAQKTLLLFRGQVVTFTVGRGANNAGTPTGTVVTFPTGEVMTAGPGVAGGTGGTASGGDTNVNGNTVAGATGGAGPTIGSFIGAASLAGPNPPGLGAGANNTGGSISGGSGILYLQSGKV